MPRGWLESSPHSAQPWGRVLSPWAPVLLACPQCGCPSLWQAHASEACSAASRDHTAPGLTGRGTSCLSPESHPRFPCWSLTGSVRGSDPWDLLRFPAMPALSDSAPHSPTSSPGKAAAWAPVRESGEASLEPPFNHPCRFTPHPQALPIQPRAGTRESRNQDGYERGHAGGCPAPEQGPSLTRLAALSFV